MPLGAVFRIDPTRRSSSIERRTMAIMGDDLDYASCGVKGFTVDCALMISNDAIAEAVRILVDATNPIKVILFGSYARGDARNDSDLDLLVVERELVDKRAEMVRLRNLLRPLRIPVDIIVVSKDEFADWAHLNGTVLHWAAREGRVMHEAAA